MVLNDYCCFIESLSSLANYWENQYEKHDEPFLHFEWKDENKKGLDCVVKITRDGNVITLQTENLGIAIHSVTTIQDDVRDVYIVLTGDQCAITKICVTRDA